jgi:hypothetical protein
MVFHQAGCWDAISLIMEELKKNEAWKEVVDEALTYIHVGLTVLLSQYGH